MMKKADEKPNIVQRVSMGLIMTSAVLLAVFFIALPDRAFSVNENRTLAQKPSFSVKKVLDGSFMTDTEDWIADQFPLRDRWYAFSVQTARLSGKKEINGVYLCGEDRLIDVYEKPVNTKKFTDAVARLSANLERARVTLLLVPTAVTLNEEDLPAEAAESMEAHQRDAIDEILGAPALAEAGVQGFSAEDALRALGEEETDLFYRTDHHWTTRGAYAGVQTIAPALGLSVGNLPKDRLRVVSENFYGTTWSKICDPSIRPDRIEIYENPDWSGALRVEYTDDGLVTDTPYNMAYLEEKDQYSVFLDNLHTLVAIENPAAPERALAVVKDSYANCMIPYLIDHYRQIYVFDPRYYRGGISSFVNDHPEITDVLVLYNLATMDSDRGIGAID